jgi:cellulose synthase/poly-beta-1,6-N-acetylglucosamine synthase-like glycosyltransferase
VSLDLLRWAVYACFGYLVVIYAGYFALSAVSLFEGVFRARQRDAEDLAGAFVSHFTIPVSVLFAAYNEEVPIVNAVRSVLANDYPEFEVIVVSDGSTDGTLDVLREAFQLQRRHIFFRKRFETKAIRGIYRSTSDPRLIVVDKENGGKADSLNCALNFARYRYVLAIDADTILAPDALMAGMRLVLRDPGNVLGVTSILGVAETPEERVAEPRGARRVDRSLLLAFQQLDFERSYLTARLGWSRFNFMLCNAGAFAMWRRDVLEEVGGFSTTFTCEDIELTFRVHEHFRRTGKPYRILSLGETVGATEGPTGIRSLIRQRERWQRVIMETVFAYRGMLGRRRYGTVGSLGLPFYVLSEIVAPFAEVVSFVVLGVAVGVGQLDLRVFLLSMVTLAVLNGVLTNVAVLVDDYMNRLYRVRDLLRLCLLGPFELFLYRPIVILARARGVVGYLRGDQGWNKFERNARAAA